MEKLEKTNPADFSEQKSELLCKRYEPGKIKDQTTKIHEMLG
ncbi:hypothetical protein OROMI_016118 [Orobanche minor]